MKNLLVNPIKKTGGGGGGGKMTNLAISSQMTIKLGKNIL